MGALEYFQSRGVRLELLTNDSIRTIGHLDDALRASIMAQKPALIAELQWQEFESLLAIAGPAYRTPECEYAAIRTAARGDLADALMAYREMADQIAGATSRSRNKS